MFRMVLCCVGLVFAVVMMSLAPMATFAQSGEGDVAVALTVVGVDACDYTKAPLVFTVKALDMNTGSVSTTTMIPRFTTCLGIDADVFTLPAGVYSLQVSANEFEIAYQEIEVVAGSRVVVPMTIVFHPNPSVQVYLTTDGGVSCADEYTYSLGTLTVTDAYWQTVYSSQVVSLCGEHPVGSFRIPAGSYTARITVPGYDSGASSFIAETGGAASVSIRIAGGAMGTLADEDVNWLIEEGFTKD
ncbi:MAG TPA: hypothetical protein VNZ58_01830 [Thermomicrobiales bacterium]|nr:hypothetical protein [Thermomicrobiales bacterium]